MILFSLEVVENIIIIRFKTLEIKRAVSDTTSECSCKPLQKGFQRGVHGVKQNSSVRFQNHCKSDLAKVSPKFRFPSPPPENEIKTVFITIQVLISKGGP